MKNLYIFLLVVGQVATCPYMVFAQNKDAQNLVSAMLGETPIEEDLQELCDEIGGRVTGSKANEQSVEWAIKKFEEAGVKVKKQAFKMPSLWLEKSTTATISGGTNFSPQIVSKFYSPAKTHTGKLLNGGMGTAEDFERLGASAKGAFVLVETEICLDIGGLFAEYTAASKTEDLARAAGVQGLVFMSSRPNKLLYSFVSKKVYDNEIPQLVMAREDAKRCLRNLQENKSLQIEVTIDAETGGEYTSHNVIGEIRGSEKPNEVIIIGAHLDSWALGTGANDNGCNVTMMIDIARQMKKLGIKPKRTIRFALWNGEEQGYFGSWAYTDKQGKKLNKHIMAMSVEVDLKSLKINSAIIAAVTLGFANLPDEKITWERHSHEQIEALVEEQSLEFSMRMFNVWKAWAEGERGRQK